MPGFYGYFFQSARGLRRAVGRLPRNNCADLGRPTARIAERFASGVIRRPVHTACPTMILPISLRHTLRARTRPAHEAVEAAFAAFDLATLPGYRLFLRAHAAAITAVERQLVTAGVVNVVSDWPLRQRTDVVATDLHRLGLRGMILTCPPLGSRGAVLAAMYVLEGSRLGGRILLAQAMRSPSAEVRAATVYLRHQPGMQLWTEFLALLDVHHADAAAVEQMVAHATSVFDVFARAASQAATAGSRRARGTAERRSAADHGFATP